MRVAGVAVQEPIAVLESRRWGFISKAVYVCAYVSDAMALSQALPPTHKEWDGLSREDLLKVLAKETRRLHDRGFSHGDLKAGNILASHAEGVWRIWFIDLEGALAGDGLTARARAVDVGRLWYDLLQLATDEEREGFLREYLRSTPMLNRSVFEHLIKERVEKIRMRKQQRDHETKVVSSNDAT